MSEPLTLEQIVAIEPKVRYLIDEAKAVDGSGERFCANELWYGPGHLKEAVCRLVGWDAKDSRLTSCEAYDVAYQAVYDALPPCKDCLCA